MNTITTEQIKIWGIVQGVGFRPFVAKVAQRLSMKGEVLNLGGLVQLILTDTKPRIDAFLDTLKKEKPDRQKSSISVARKFHPGNLQGLRFFKARM